MPARRGGSLVAAVPGTHTQAMQGSLTVTLNGESRTLPAPISVAGMLATLGLDTRKVAVERNEEIVPRSAYATTQLADRDALEVVHFIGGG